MHRHRIITAAVATAALALPTATPALADDGGGGAIVCAVGCPATGPGRAWTDLGWTQVYSGTDANGATYYYAARVWDVREDDEVTWHRQWDWYYVTWNGSAWETAGYWTKTCDPPADASGNCHGA